MINIYDERQTLLNIIEKYGSKEIYQVLVKKFMVKLQQEEDYNNFDLLLDVAIEKTDELYNKLDVRIPTF